MVEEARKATDILISIETKVEQLLALYRNHDLLLKTFNNKLNDLASTVKSLTDENQPKDNPLPDQVERIVLPVEEKPSGFRRTSRPDVYDTKSAPLKETNTQFPEYKPEQLKVKSAQQQSSPTLPTEIVKIPVSQRIVDKNSKAIFLADVEITNSSNDETIYKCRTNSIGKWSAVLAPGSYRVRILKQESLSKEKFDINQSINVDAKRPSLDLPVLIIK